MKCCNCNANINDTDMFCPECGAKQEPPLYCANCGTRLEPDELFCHECGAKTDGSVNSEVEPEAEPSMTSPETPEPAPSMEAPETPGLAPAPRKGKGGRIALIFILAAVILLAVAGFFVYRALNGGGKTADTHMEEEKEKTAKDKQKEKKKDPEEIDVTKADIVATGGETCALEGTIKTDHTGRKVIAWNEGVSISGLDEFGKAVLAKDVTNVYINDIGLEEGILDTVASNKKVILNGQIYFVSDSIYIKANKITDDSGNVIENNKDRNSQEVRQTISYDYIIPYSNAVLLNEGDIAGLSLQEINYAKNEIYARHGRMFKSPELQNYFNSKSWYVGTVSADQFSDAMLSEVEKKNVTYLSDVEFSINPAGYQLDVR